MPRDAGGSGDEFVAAVVTYCDGDLAGCSPSANAMHSGDSV
jgi:hypothetical protein